MKTCKEYQNRQLDDLWFSKHIDECSICQDYFNSLTELKINLTNQVGTEHYFSELPERVLSRIRSSSNQKPNIVWVTSTSVAAIFLAMFTFLINPVETDNLSLYEQLTVSDVVNYFQTTNYHQLLDPSTNEDINDLIENIASESDLPIMDDDGLFNNPNLDKVYEEELVSRRK